jgi:hypothetical protein
MENGDFSGGTYILLRVCDHRRVSIARTVHFLVMGESTWVEIQSISRGVAESNTALKMIKQNKECHL